MDSLAAQSKDFNRLRLNHVIPVLKTRHFSRRIHGRFPRYQMGCLKRRLAQRHYPFPYLRETGNQSEVIDGGSYHEIHTHDKMA